MGADNLRAIQPGTALDGYRIDSVLGSGGFGITYLGHDIALDKPVAIKEYMPSDLAVRITDNSVVPESRATEQDFHWGLERFLEEARALGKFQHRNIVSVFNFVRTHGTAYIVMEYVAGETVSSRLGQAGGLDEAQLRSILDPLLSGLASVHAGDFLHRDIKPSNIILRPDGSPVLIDFGSARQSVTLKSRSVTAIVTPGYAPIEQYSSRGRQGAWTDIYALGAICYRAMTGEVPVDATERVRNDPLVPASQHPKAKDRYSPTLLAAVDAALAVEEDDRPQSVAAWRVLLDDERGLTQKVAPAPPPSAPTPTPDAPTPSNRSRNLVVAAAGVLAIALAGMGINRLMDTGGGGTPPPDQPTARVAQIEPDPSTDDDQDDTASPATPQPDLEPPAGTEEDIAWATAQADDSLNAYTAYLEAYPEGLYVDDANLAITALRDAIRDLQRGLRDLGLYRAGIDGDPGPGTQNATNAFLDQNSGDPIDLQIASKTQIQTLAERVNEVASQGPAYCKDSNSSTDLQRQEFDILIVRLAQELGNQHAVRTLCTGSDDQYWRAFMIRILDVEAPYQGSLRRSLVNSFNAGYGIGGDRFNNCDEQAVAFQRSAEADIRPQLLSITQHLSYESNNTAKQLYCDIGLALLKQSGG